MHQTILLLLIKLTLLYRQYLSRAMILILKEHKQAGHQTNYSVIFLTRGMIKQNGSRTLGLVLKLSGVAQLNGIVIHVKIIIHKLLRHNGAYGLKLGQHSS